MEGFSVSLAASGGGLDQALTHLVWRAAEWSGLPAPLVGGLAIAGAALGGTLATIAAVDMAAGWARRRRLRRGPPWSGPG